MNSPIDLWYGTSGLIDADVVLVAESWGAEEAVEQKPLIGQAGNELTRMLNEAGIDRSKILLTNVAAIRPTNNEMWRLFHPTEAPSGLPLIRGLDPTQQVRSELERLYLQIGAFPRKLVIACGNYALWALTDSAGVQKLRASNNRKIPSELQPMTPNGIMNWRGSMWYMLDGPLSSKYSKTQLLPLIHPASIMRQWSQRAPTVHDLKARVPKALRGDWRPNPMPVFYAPPTLQQCVGKLESWLALADSGRQFRLVCDIETNRGFITCVGFADSKHFAMSVPFVRLLPDKSFTSWWNQDEESKIISLIRRVLRHPNILIEGQNFVYDTQYFQHWMAVTPRLDFDTMLAQNVLFPGTEKRLDYLSSLYCHYHWFWKEDHKEWEAKGSIEELLVYNCWDCVRTYEVADVQRTVLAKEKQEPQMALKMRINDLCLRMMNRGVLIDMTRRKFISGELMTALHGLEQQLEYIVPQPMVDPNAKTPWYRSHKQTKELFYDIFRFEVVHDRKTGQPTVGKEARGILKRKYPEFTGLFERLRIYGSAENTHNVVNAGLDSDNRLRCSYNPGGAETHRLSSSQTPFGRGTNLQNLTTGEEDD